MDIILEELSFLIRNVKFQQTNSSGNGGHFNKL